MKLYYSPGACSLSPHIVLRESGVPFDIIKVDLGTKKTAGGADFTKVNAKGYVPALELDNGEVLTEVAAIVQYVGDKAGNGLMPKAGSMERYRQQEWLTFISSEIHKAIAPLWSDKTPAVFKEQAKAALQKRFVFLDQHLAKNDYLMGKEFTAADAYAFTVIGWTKLLDIDISSYPNIGAYLARVGARPKVQEALRAEGLA